jgi:putative MATE family efflux protein
MLSCLVIRHFIHTTPSRAGKQPKNGAPLPTADCPRPKAWAGVTWFSLKFPMEAAPAQLPGPPDATSRIGTDAIGPLLLRYSVPSIIGMLVHALYNIVDRMFIGRGIGAGGIAGVTLSFPLMMAMISFSILVGVGANTLFSIRMGEGRREEAERILGNAFGLLFFVPLAASLAALAWLDPLLRLVGASEALLPQARIYARIILAGSALSTTGHGLAHFIRSDGRPVVSMVAMVIGAAANILLDAWFIFGLGWGMAGAAWATVIAQGLAFVWSFAYFLSPWARTRLRRHQLRLDLRQIVWPMLAIGFSPFAMNFANSLLNVVLNKGLGRYGGDDAIAVMGILSAYMSLIFMPVFGITQGAQPLIGYNYGARKFARVRRLFWSTAAATTVLMVAGWLLSQFCPAQIMRLFAPAGSDLIPLGAHALRVFSLAFPIIGFPITGGHLFQAIGKPVPAALLALSRQILFFVPFILIFPRYWGLPGIYAAAPASDLLTFAISLFLVGHQLRRLRRLEAEAA